MILDIFALRAQSFEGKLQVELAQLKHLSTRLVRGWTHLERQKGGIGLRGPGETQLETDRRLLGKRIKYLNNRLAKVARQREQGRQARNKADIPTVSLVGYTNAGKSTLFNALTDASMSSRPISCLPRWIRPCANWQLSEQQNIILADTVGFIRHLPHDLVAAFRATLMETREADLILHVVDSADDNRQDKIDAVNRVLHEVGAGDTPQLLLYNKIDYQRNCSRALTWMSRAKPGASGFRRLARSGFEQLHEVLRQRFCEQTSDLSPDFGGR